MKGIAHFCAGVAATSCFPDAVAAGAAGNPLYFILGGAFGLLPDTLDFKFARFLHRHDVEVIPDPLRPDARMIAQALADAADHAAESGEPVTIKLSTIRLGADRWQQYEVRFDVPDQKVHVAYGPEVNTSGEPLSSAGRAAVKSEAVVPVLCRLRLEYLATTKVDAFDGPEFRFEPSSDGHVTPVFIPWHRRWSHSLVTGLAAGALVALWRPLAGAVIAAAAAAHCLLDQTGFLGSSLLYPLRRGRTPGWRAVHSGDAIPNLAAVWLSGCLVFWNLYCGLPGPCDVVFAWRLLFWAVVLPALALAVLRRLLRSLERANPSPGA
jgi:hypothetical protein